MFFWEGGGQVPLGKRQCAGGFTEGPYLMLIDDPLGHLSERVHGESKVTGRRALPGFESRCEHALVLNHSVKCSSVGTS